MLNEKQIKKIANSIARKAGYGKATEIHFSDIEKGKVMWHNPWGFRTNSGKFFAHVRTTRYAWNGRYESAETAVLLPIHLVTDYLI